MWGIIPAAGQRQPHPAAGLLEGAAAGRQPPRWRASSGRAPSANTWSSACCSAAPTRSASSSRPANPTSWNITARAMAGAAIAYVVQPQAGGLVRRDLPRGAAGHAGRTGAGRSARHDLVSRGCPARLPDDRLAFLLFPVDRPELFDAVVDRSRRTCAGDPGQSRSGRIALDLGRVQDAGARACTSCTRSGQRAPSSDEYFGTLVNAYLAGGGRAQGVKAGTRLCRCRHARRLSRRDAAARPDAATDAAPRGARFAALSKSSLRKCRSRTVSTQVLDRDRDRASASAAARALVPQHRPRRRADRAGPFPRRLSRRSNGGASRTRSRPISPARPCSTSAATAASTRSR